MAKTATATAPTAALTLADFDAKDAAFDWRIREAISEYRSVNPLASFAEAFDQVRRRIESEQEAFGEADLNDLIAFDEASRSGNPVPDDMTRRIQNSARRYLMNHQNAASAAAAIDALRNELQAEADAAAERERQKAQQRTDERARLERILADPFRQRMVEAWLCAQSGDGHRLRPVMEHLEEVVRTLVTHDEDTDLRRLPIMDISRVYAEVNGLELRGEAPYQRLKHPFLPEWLRGTK